ncbi:MAG: glycosyltransferase family 9 protein [Candidatus Binataceae bacterium]|jgi:ADP-heptose:LPS heptosyltransferase
MAADFRLHEYSQSELNVRSALRTLRQIRACAYDAIVNFEQGSLAGTGFLRATGIPNRLGLLSFANSAKAAFLTHCLAFRAQDSMWQSFGRLLRLVDPSLPADLPPMPLPLAEAAVQHARAWLEARVDGSYVRKTVFHLGCGAGQPFKRWPIASFAALARRLAQSFPDQSIILTGQPSERALVEEFNSQYGGPSIDATGLTSLALTAGVLSQADLLVSNDTGIMHLGAAVGTPTVGLFGASSPDQWAPFGPRVSYVYATKLGCSPCINSYLNIVPDHCGNRDVGGCMADINPEVVFAAARKVIRGSWLD